MGPKKWTIAQLTSQEDQAVDDVSMSELATLVGPHVEKPAGNYHAEDEGPD